MTAIFISLRWIIRVSVYCGAFCMYCAILIAFGEHDYCGDGVMLALVILLPLCIWFAFSVDRFLQHVLRFMLPNFLRSVRVANIPLLVDNMFTSVGVVASVVLALAVIVLACWFCVVVSVWMWMRLPWYFALPGIMFVVGAVYQAGIFVFSLLHAVFGAIYLFIWWCIRSIGRLF